METNTGEITIAILTSSLFVLMLVIAFLLLFKNYLKNKKKLLSENELMKAHFSQELLRTQLEIQEQTLKNISQEIHDNIGQTLSLAKLNLSTIDLEKKEGAELKISNSKDLVSKAIIDLRSLSKTLHTDSILSAGLLKAIQFELEQIDKAGIFHTELLHNGPGIKNDPKKELIIFRIVQEALNNIIKHSGATLIKIHIENIPGYLILNIEDNGCGFEATAQHDFITGSGLRNMRSRAQLIGGSFDIQSNAVSGTHLKITIPITES